MKYMLLIYGAEGVLTETERQECYGESAALCRALADDGKFLAAAGAGVIALWEVRV